MTKYQTNNLRAALIAFISFSAFSGADTIVKTLSARIGVYETTFLLSVFALSFLVFHSLARGQARQLLPLYPKLAFGRALLLSMNTLLIYYAFSALPLAEAYVLGFLSPILVAVVAFIMVGERLSLRGWAGVILGFAGVVWVLQPGAAPLSSGHLAALGSALFFAIAQVMLRRARNDESDRALVVALLLVQSCFAGLLALYNGLMPVSWQNLALAALGGGLIAFAQTMIVKAFRLGSASVVAPVQYSQIIWGLIYGALLFNAPVELHMLSGAVIILISGWLVLQ
ncbi:DMT family transporter [Pseudochrobactrum sp. HB0163]|uniref:DMT family transporter n=1 Tax=Pseudochrobactrum sp. HB0163 TaxID=3450708 RepID=UPI003F6DEBEA